MSFCILTVPYDSGRLRERMGQGPDFLLRNVFEPLLTRLGAEFCHEEIGVEESHPAEIASAFELCRRVSQRVRGARSEGSLPIVLSGNCGIAIGAIAGCEARRTGAVWFDAHGEGNTPETTTTGFLDGMGIAVLIGQCWTRLAASIPGFEPLRGGKILLVGSRDVEPAEAELLDQADVVRAAGTAGLDTLVAKAAEGTDGVYVHFDLDVLDPSQAVANQWTPRGGLKLRELLDAAAAIRRQTTVKGFGFASYDPAMDTDGHAMDAARAIAELLLAPHC